MAKNTGTALVTGGTSGIGYELAKLIAKDGYNIILVARTEGDLNVVKKEIETAYGVAVTVIPKDLFVPGAAEELYNEVKARGQTVNLLVNDAAQGQFGPFLESPITRDVEIIQLNIVALTVLTKLFLRDMVARNEGRVLQLASVVSKMPGPFLAVYSATKAYVYNLTQGLINELQDTNITITALLPGMTDTDFFRKADGLDTKGYQEEDLADPADVAKDGYEALMSGESKIVSGFKNKMQMAMSNITPDETLAENMRKLNKEKE